jgi:fructokinase
VNDKVSIMPDILCIGELLVDFVSMAKDASLEDAPAFAKAAGGAPANVAVAIIRLGGSSGFIGAVGDDPFGAYLARTLRREGVDVSGLVQPKGQRTPLAFAAVRSDGAGDFFFVCDRGGAAPLRPEHVRPDQVASAKALHFGSISRIDEAARQATDLARKIAADKRLLISYDPNYRPRLWSDAPTARRRIVEGFTGSAVAKVSQQEWAFALGTEDFAAGARQLLDRGVQLVIRSEGGDGASFATARHRGHVAAFKVNCVEFTGAGDAFVASVLVDLVAMKQQGLWPAELEDSVLRRIIRRANAVGALTTMRPGAIPALPTKQQVEEFLRQVGEG